MQLKNRYSLLLAGLLLPGFTIMAQESYLAVLQPGSSAIFQHLNLKSAEITGQSRFSYQIMSRDGSSYIVENNENSKPDGEVFTRKTLWFEANSGVAKWYEEQDLRKNFRISSSYSGEIMYTRLDQDGEVLEFETNLNREQAVPFELVIFFLRKNLQQILQNKAYAFNLFLPLLAIELEKKGLLRSMSMIRMRVEAQPERQLKTPLGDLKAQTILLSPQSGFLRALLPREKTHFEFTFSAAAPYHLLQFEEGTTRHVLTELQQPE
ncbi:MAG: hypothetical protein H8E38_01010 [SAR324 cluster bacterium]|nr:hypothetical protein [SAR324 cluster bacterium]MBL7035801.1 hypothetical protein [SAR324 cluster bacterium]